MALPDLETAIYTKLASISALTSITSRIASFAAIPGWARPYVTFVEASHVTPNIVTSDMINSVWRVSCWADTPDGARALEDAVFDGLHEASLTLSGWTVYWLVHEGRQHIHVEEDGDEYWHYVGDYRLKADNQ